MSVTAQGTSIVDEYVSMTQQETILYEQTKATYARFAPKETTKGTISLASSVRDEPGACRWPMDCVFYKTV
jgi:hypothetical protein